MAARVYAHFRGETPKPTAFALSAAHRTSIITQNSFRGWPCCLFTQSSPSLNPHTWSTSPSSQWGHRLHSRVSEPLQVSGLEGTR